MLDQPTAGSKLSRREMEELNSWGLVKDYRKYRPVLVNLAKDIYIAAGQVFADQPTQDQVYQLYRSTLPEANAFKDIVTRVLNRKQYMPPSLYQHFANLLAKYVLEKDWEEISNQ